MFQSLGLRDAATRRREIEMVFSHGMRLMHLRSGYLMRQIHLYVGELSVEEAKAERRAFMYYWKNRSIKIIIIEIHSISAKFILKDFFY